MATDTQLRAWWLTYRCRTSKFDPVAFPGVDRTWRLAVADKAAPAFNLFARAMTDTGYLFREAAGGTYNCRRIAGSNAWSIHSYGLAIDLNPSKNPHRSPLTHNYPPAFISLVEGIRTGNGKQTFQWGGRWSTPDAMHWQINCSPADLTTGVVYPKSAPAPIQEDLMLPIGPGSPPEDIRSIQGLLNTGFNAGLVENGEWDPATKAAAAKHLGAATGDTKAKAGEYVNARMYRELLIGLVKAVAPAGSGGADPIARDGVQELRQKFSRVKAVL